MPADRPTILATSGGYRSDPRLALSFGPLVHHAVDPNPILRGRYAMGCPSGLCVVIGENTRVGERPKCNQRGCD